MFWNSAWRSRFVASNYWKGGWRSRFSDFLNRLGNAHAVFKNRSESFNKVERMMGVLCTYLNEHIKSPHAPVVDDDGNVTCICFGCELARDTIAVAER